VSIFLAYIISLPLLIATVPMQTDSDGPMVWVEDGMTWVFKGDPTKSDTSISLYAAKNEYEPFQIIVKAPTSNDLTNINITMSDLQGENGNLISSDNIALYREHYLYVS
jgi:hypothetical protein